MGGWRYWYPWRSEASEPFRSGVTGDFELSDGVLETKLDSVVLLTAESFLQTN